MILEGILCAGENWTGSVARHLVALPVAEKIVPATIEQASEHEKPDWNG